MSSASTLSVGGLASGTDTNSIIDQLVALEQQKVTKIQKRQATAETTLSTLGKLKSQLATFKDKATGLSTINGFSIYKSNSSDSDTADIQTGADGKGVEGNFAVDVKQLASSLKVASNSFADATAALGFSGTLRISTSAAHQASTTGTAGSTYVDIGVNASDALSDIAARINTATGSGASATVLNVSSGDTRLVLTGVDSGAAGFTISDPNASVGSDLAKALGFTSGSTRSESDFSFRLAAGGAAKDSSKLTDIFTGVGHTIAVGDTLTYLDKAYTVTADNTLGDVMRRMATDLGTAEGNISLDNSGRIVAKGVDVSTLAVKLTRASDGSSQVLGSMESKGAFANVIQEGQDAFYTLNGLSLQSAANSDQNALDGATIELRKTTGSSGPVQVEVARDDAAIKGKVSEFLDSYNSLIGMINSNSTVTIEKSKDADGKTVNTPTYGPFVGESSVAALKNQLRSIMTSSIEALSGKTKFTSFASIGITTDAKEGTLKLDDTKFNKALSSDFDGVRRLFAASGWSSDPHVTVGRWSNTTKTGNYEIDTVGNTISNLRADGSVDPNSTVSANRSDNLLVSRDGNSSGMMLNAPASVGTAKVTFVRGVADQISQLYNQVTDYASGTLTSASKSTQSRIDDFTKHISEQQDRVDSYRQRLVNQFTAMEKSMQNIKSQSNSFMSQIGRT